jgi:hypothetical protein
MSRKQLEEEKDVRRWGATHIPLPEWKRAFYADVRSLVCAVREDDCRRVDEILAYSKVDASVRDEIAAAIRRK